jgi:hypothetical protein
MFGHRVNSEGLRGRAIALGGSAPKKGYIGFGRAFCQPFRSVKQAQETRFCAGFSRLCVDAGNATAPAFCDARRTPNFATYLQSAPHCGHIPPPFFGK